MDSSVGFDSIDNIGSTDRKGFRDRQKIQHSLYRYYMQPVRQYKQHN
jgi:hypothetical protein